MKKYISNLFLFHTQYIIRLEYTLFTLNKLLYFKLVAAINRHNDFCNLSTYLFFSAVRIVVPFFKS